MGLTRLRASQISDIDYKQSVRAVTTADVTLSGGAPATVDGVSLSLNNRILVTAQGTGSQNGIYYVTTVGSGADGTWARSSDTNSTGELLAGTIVMVTEGSTYADTQWKLTTNDPIVIGTTPLTFVINILSQIGGGNTQIQYNNAGTMGASANLTWNGATLYANGAVSATGNVTGGNLLTTGLISATGAITGAVITGTSLTVSTGNITSGNLILSGAIVDSAQLDIQTTAANANIVLTPHGTGNVNVVRMRATGDITSTSNIAALNFNSTSADLAEMYSADAAYAPGTVLVFGGLEEVTINDCDHNTAVAGVVSTAPSYLMNSAQQGEFVLPIALTGRVPCRVQGPVNKGTVLVSGTVPGTAVAIDVSKFKPGCVLGKSLETINTNDIKTIEIAVGRL